MENEVKTIPYNYGTDRVGQEMMANDLRKFGKAALFSVFAATAATTKEPQSNPVSIETVAEAPTTKPAAVPYTYGNDPAGRATRELEVRKYGAAALTTPT